MPSLLELPVPETEQAPILSSAHDDDDTVDMEVDAEETTAPSSALLSTFSSSALAKALGAESFVADDAGNKKLPVVEEAPASNPAAATTDTTTTALEEVEPEEEEEVPADSNAKKTKTKKKQSTTKKAKKQVKVTPTDTPKKTSKKVQQEKSSSGSQTSLMSFFSKSSSHHKSPKVVATAANSESESSTSNKKKSIQARSIAAAFATASSSSSSGTSTTTSTKTKKGKAKTPKQQEEEEPKTPPAPMELEADSLVEMVECPTPPPTKTTKAISAVTSNKEPASNEETQVDAPPSPIQAADAEMEPTEASSTSVPKDDDSSEPVTTTTTTESEQPETKDTMNEESSTAGPSPMEVEVLEPVAQPAEASSETSDDKKKDESTETPAPATKEATKPAKKKAAPKKKATPEPPKPLVPVDHLPEERQTLFRKYDGMEARYLLRAQELCEGARGGLEEEQFERPALQQEVVDEAADLDHATVTANIVLLVEGSSLQLSKLVTTVSEKLAEAHGKTWNAEDIATKIKLLAERKPHLEPNYKEPSASETVDIFENDTEDRMWRWEVISIDILPSAVVSKIRKARTARNKLRQHQAATLRLVQSVRKAMPLIRDPSCPKTKLDTAIAKLSKEEERVLKYEREAEKQKLAKQAKRQKELEAEAKKLEKEKAAEEKKRAKERKQQEAEQKKIEQERQKREAAEAREEAKKKKIQQQKEKEEQQKAEEKRKEQSIKKQASCLMNFFGAPKSSSPSKQQGEDSTTVEDKKNAPIKSDQAASKDDFDAEKFRASFNSNKDTVNEPLFPKLSPRAVASRKRRTRQVSVSVYVTIMPDNAFDAQPFAEQQIIQIPNKYRFLSFHEDCRPAYHGTWSKTSTTVTGRNPFGKETGVLDYEYDSEAEWEEGDDEIGEDVNDDGKDQDEDMVDEEGDTKNYNYQDGWMVDDDEPLECDEDMDDDTRGLYKKKSKNEAESMMTPVCIVAPCMGGIPVHDFESASSAGVVEGFSVEEARNVMSSHTCLQIKDVNLCLDAFPPPLIEEGDTGGEAASSSAKSDGNKNSLGKDEYSPEDMKILARFAHHCTLNSKDKVISDLKEANPDRFQSRAKVTRKLDSIAVKQKRRSSTGYFWEVKKEVLEELGLTDLIALKMEGEDVEPEPKKKAAAASKKKDASKTGANKKTTTKKRKSSGGESAKKPASKKAKSSESSSSDAAAPTEQESSSSAATKKPAAAGSATKKAPTPSKKRAAPAGSVNLMASFLVRKKVKPSPAKAQEAETTGEVKSVPEETSKEAQATSAEEGKSSSS